MSPKELLAAHLSKESSVSSVSLKKSTVCLSLIRNRLSGGAAVKKLSLKTRSREEKLSYATLRTNGFEDWLRSSNQILTFIIVQTKTVFPCIFANVYVQLLNLILKLCGIIVRLNFVFPTTSTCVSHRQLDRRNQETSNGTGLSIIIILAVQSLSSNTWQRRW